MWANGDDFNEKGERVRLYQPIAYTSGRSFSVDDPTVSYIGGPRSTTLTSASFCSQCQGPLDRLVQLHIPQHQTTYQVLGCNSAKCANALFSEHRFSLGGGGVFECYRVDAKSAAEKLAGDSSVSKDEPRLDMPPHRETTAEETNDWMIDSDDDEDNDEGGLKDLEQQVAAIEMNRNRPEPKTRSTDKSTKNKNGYQVKNNNDGLPCFELHSLLEPPGQHKSADLDDDDDDSVVGMGGINDNDNFKIQQMLAKYMAEEEDEDILAALQGTFNGGGSAGHKSREKDERLKATDRALYAFTDRIKRSPQQVLRYAGGGVPLWSIPRAPQTFTNNKQRKSKISFQEQKRKQKNANNAVPFVIPKCACGRDRRFAFQLMPSLLHVLEVDKHAPNVGSHDLHSADLGSIMNQDYGGMNWGAIAVYVCPNALETCSKKEFLILQASIDETPQKRAIAPASATVIIQDDQKFDALNDEGDLEGDFNYGGETDDESQIDEKDLVFSLDG